MGLPNPSRETKLSGANPDRETFIFPVQRTTCRIGNLTRSIHTFAICVTIHTPKWVCEREAHINWSMVPAKATLVRNYLEVYWPCAGGLSAVNAIGTQLRDPINSVLTRWRMAILNK